MLNKFLQTSTVTGVVAISSLGLTSSPSTAQTLACTCSNGANQCGGASVSECSSFCADWQASVTSAVWCSASESCVDDYGQAYCTSNLNAQKQQRPSQSHNPRR